MGFSKIKNSLVQITKEMIPVILGIMIALWINNWQKNKGYPTAEHRSAIEKYGITKYHRKSFKLLPSQLTLKF